MKKVFACLAVGLVIVFLMNMFSSKRAPEVVIERDTVVIRDTIRDTLLQTVYQHIHHFDSIPYYVKADTVFDTVYVHIPVERREYRTDEYHAIIEGYKPELVFMETYNKTIKINEVKTVKSNPEFGIGVQVGLGTDFNKITPYIGIGIQYNFKTW